MTEDTHDDEVDYDDREFVTCPRCMGLGTVTCHCGGDLCVCLNYGEAPCSVCDTQGEVSEDAHEAYLKREREAMAAFHKVRGTT